MATERLISGASIGGDDERFNWALRPTRLAEYVGQSEVIERVSIAATAARARGEPMEHVLLHGPPGLGKTTLAHLVGQEMGAAVHLASGPALARPTDLVRALTNLKRGDVLFIDEIHRLPIAVEEFVYPAMEEFRVDICTDGGMHAQVIQLTIQPFTLIGATTRAGLLSGPMRSRFGMVHHLNYYTPEELVRILARSAGLLGMERVDPSVLRRIAERARGTPRIANRLLRRVRDFAQVRAGGEATIAVVDAALALEGIDALGLDELDRAYLRVIAETYRGGPVGLDAVAATMNEDAGTLEDVVEPFLLRLGFLARHSRGRRLTPAAAEHLGVKIRAEADPDSLFSG